MKMFLEQKYKSGGVENISGHKNIVGGTEQMYLFSKILKIF